MMNRQIAMAALASAVVLTAAAARCREAGEDPGSWDRYKVIVERNIFLPERSRAAQKPTAPVVQRRLQSEVFLAGVATRGDERVAILEDRRARTTSRLRVGDETPRGRITSITLDHIVCEKDQESCEVKVGARVESVSSEEAAGEEQAGSEADSTTEGENRARPSDETDGSSGDILERMRQRRQRELN